MTENQSGANDAHNTELQKIISSLPIDHAGNAVYLSGWRLKSTDMPPIVVVHDLGEHGGLYQKTAETLAAHGFTTYVFDLRGHGRSGRRLGVAPSFELLVKDLLQVAAWVRHQESGRVPIIIGQGVGALIVMDFMRLHSSFCHGAILSAPVLEPRQESTTTVRIVLRTLSDLLPSWVLRRGMYPWFARKLIQRAKSETKEDKEKSPPPLLTAKLAHELLLAIERIPEQFGEFHGQVLILCPGDDPITSYMTLRKLTALHSEHNLKLQEFADMGHSLLTNRAQGREMVLEAILPWLKQTSMQPKQQNVPADTSDTSDSRAFLGSEMEPAADTSARPHRMESSEILEKLETKVPSPPHKPGASKE